MQQQSNPWLYSKEYLLSFYSKSCPLLKDMDLELGATTTEAFDPLANLPLTEVEKKILNSFSINSDSNKRSNFKNYKKKGSTESSAQGVPRQKSIDSPGDNGKEMNDEEVKQNTEDLWDTPTGIGNFGADGVFQEREKHSLGSISRGNSSSMQASPLIPNSPPVTLNGLGLPFDPFSNSNNSNKKSMMMESNPDNLPVMPEGVRIPPFHFKPCPWIYRDPSGVLQGPFTSQQMQEWFSDGFFTPDLPIKHVDDPVFQPLAFLVDRYGPKTPFLAELEATMTMARRVYERNVLNMTGLASASSGNARPFEQFTSPSSLPVSSSLISSKLSEAPSNWMNPVSPVRGWGTATSAPSPTSISMTNTSNIVESKMNHLTLESNLLKETKSVISPTSIAPWANKKPVVPVPEVANKPVTPVVLASTVLPSKPVAPTSNPNSNPWGIKTSKSPQSNKTLSDIMKEEKSLDSVASQSFSSSAKRYADLVSISSPSFVAAKQQMDIPSQNSHASHENPNAGWSVVGKSGQVIPPERSAPPTLVKKPSIIASPHLGISIPAKPKSAASPGSPASPVVPQATSKPVVSPAFVSWFFTALQGIPPSSGVNVKAFLNILLSISAAEKAFIVNICDDTLGGIPSIDPKRFAEEFVKHRQLDAKNQLEPLLKKNSVKPETLVNSNDADAFVVVSKKSKKKKSTV